MRSTGSPAGPKLMAISDAATRQAAGYSSLAAWLDDVVEMGVDWVQLREKAAPGRRLNQQAEQAVHQLGRAVTVWINGRVDIAQATAAGGVHLPSRGLPASAVRAKFPSLRLGVACHCQQDIVEANRHEVDYVTFSPIFATPGKGRPQGIGALQRAIKSAPMVIALGGLEPRNAEQVLSLGAGLAAIRAFHDPVLGREMVEMARQVRRVGDTSP